MDDAISLAVIDEINSLLPEGWRSETMMGVYSSYGVEAVINSPTSAFKSPYIKLLVYRRADTVVVHLLWPSRTHIIETSVSDPEFPKKVWFAIAAKLEAVAARKASLESQR